MNKDSIFAECLDLIIEIELNNDINDVFDIVRNVKNKFKGLKEVSLDLLCLQLPSGRILDNSMSIEEFSSIYNISDGVLRIFVIDKCIKTLYGVLHPVKTYFLKDKIKLNTGLKRRKVINLK